MKPELALQKVYFLRGWQYLSMPAIGISTAYALEARFGISFWISGIAGAIACLALGAIDYKYGIAKHENDLAWMLCPKAIELQNDIKEIKEMLRR
jgi:hypothetical protein